MSAIFHKDISIKIILFLQIDFSVHEKYQSKLTGSTYQQKFECFCCFLLWSKYVEILSRNVKWNNIKALCTSFDCFFFREEIVIITFSVQESYTQKKHSSGFLKFSLVLFSTGHTITSLCWYIFGIYKDPWQWPVCMWQFIGGHHDNLSL